MTKDDPRQSYWNSDYVRYWKARVDETNAASAGKSALNKGDTLTTSDGHYEEAIEILAPRADGVLLELGCGFGRGIPLLAHRVRAIEAVDISAAMIEAARTTYSSVPNVRFHVAVGENLPFEAGTFDSILCFGVFDALYQKEALIEMNRVAAPGCRVLFTGKNDNYMDDDAEALIAEERARAKGHPNFFTDIVTLLANASAFGFKVRQQRFFRRRGDFNQRRFDESPPAQFYEYLLLLEKVADVKQAPPIEVSNAYSRTWRRVKPADAS